VLLPDGRFLIGGSFAYTNSGRRYDIARLNADGSVDGSFMGGLGYLRPTKDFQHDDHHAFALQPDGKIIVGGSSSVTGLDRPPLFCALTPMALLTRP